MNTQTLPKLLLAATLALPFVGLASDEKSVAEAQQPAGMQAAIDPETGALRQPTEQESRALSEAARQRIDSFKPRTGRQKSTSAGYEVVEVGAEMWMSTVVTIGEDGKVETRCVHAEGAEMPADHHHPLAEQ